MSSRQRGLELAREVAALEASCSNTRLLFEGMRPLAAEVVELFDPLEASSPRLLATLWCRLGDMLFYLHALPFEAEEYARAIGCADRARATRLRVHTRILAARAALEVRSPALVGPLFEAAMTLGAAHPDLHADAARGLGWVHLAQGDVARATALFRAAHDAHRAIHHARGVADASMALGVVASLGGRTDEADAHFYRAEAIFRSRSDPVRLAKLGMLRATMGAPEPGLPETALDLHTLIERGQLWRAALVLKQRDDAKSQGRARVLADLAGVGWGKLAGTLAAPPPSPAIWRLVGEHTDTVLVAPDGTCHDLMRRAPARRMLHALAGRGVVSAQRLFEAGWPGERASWESALGRVYTTVRRLRRLGLRIDTADDGYVCASLEATVR